MQELNSNLSTQTDFIWGRLFAKYSGLELLIIFGMRFISNYINF